MIETETNKQEIVLQALREEERLSTATIKCKIVEVSINGTEQKIVRIEAAHSYTATTPPLDQLEGAPVWWPSLTAKNASLEIVDATDGWVQIKNVAASEIETNLNIFIKPNNFIRPLIDLWERTRWANRGLRSLEMVGQTQQVRQLVLSKHPKAHTLLTAQQKVLDIFGHQFAFFQGPPGTGKTFTLVRSIQIIMEMYPHTRIALICMTNHGADEPVKRLKEQAKRNTQGRSPRITRYGGAGDKAFYKAHPELLPIDGDPIKSASPKNGDDFEPDTFLQMPGIDVFTAFGAIQRFERLCELPLYDYVILDEASQLNKATSALLCSLGNHVMCTGDHTQLSPICKTKDPQHFPWLGESMFAFMPVGNAPNKVMLDEQTRMPEPICKFTSVFYGGKLKVADIVANEPEWLAFRRREIAGISRFNHFVIERVPVHGANKVGQHHREWSAERIVQMILEHGEKNYLHTEMAVLVPFSNQVRAVRRLLKKGKIIGVTVSTVHKVQGTEFPLVFFDPTNSAGDFMTGDIGRSVVNVAVSRAQSKVILLLSDQDLQNRHLRHAWSIAEESKLAASQMEREAGPVKLLIRHQ